MYEYAKERPGLLTDEGQRAVIRARDKALKLIGQAGAARGDRIVDGAFSGCSSNWQEMALLERLCELGTIRPADMDTERSALDTIYVLA